MGTNEHCKNMDCTCCEDKKCGTTIIKQYYGYGCGDDGTDSAGGNGHSHYIGENGNWFEWSNDINDFVDTGVQAQGTPGEKATRAKREFRGRKGYKAPQERMPVIFPGAKVHFLHQRLFPRVLILSSNLQ